ncbi:F0F1 ATP synthase subunit epsilon [Corynebacterium tapiri]|uniref:ATP synthase epsilon chain n=1 Tax=Corynebacterium tapiri TaxID=1448266 RepID=A0A5C4U7S2_9CORY|nr:F0F1 ATP synthase subunit epsilon [Corynebacterium tapiri]TNL99741.1 F0F1 ATP synthase subunit epsilon [Corynebacterium tapiri]
MADITVQMVSVDRVLWSGQATMVTAQTTEGEIGVLPGHEALLGQLVPNGIVTITPADGGQKLVAAVQEGFLSVTGEKATILAEAAKWSTDVDEAQAHEDLSSDDPKVKARGEAALKALHRAREA